MAWVMRMLAESLVMGGGSMGGLFSMAGAVVVVFVGVAVGEGVVKDRGSVSQESGRRRVVITGTWPPEMAASKVSPQREKGRVGEQARRRRKRGWGPRWAM